jgi:hypothetical protein
VKRLTAVALTVLFAACGFAQSRGFSGVQFSSPQHFQAAPLHTGGANSGFGRVLFPGTGQPPPNGFVSGRVLFPGTGGPPGSTLSITDAAFAGRLGSTVSGLNQGHQFRRFQRPVAAPYAYPVYVGGYSDSGYGYQPEQQPNVTIVNPPQQAPQVVINQNFIPERVTPVVREYGEDSSGGVRIYEAPGREPVEASAEDNANYYLIAFKDHSIYSAFAYWVEGDTLHYVTPQRVHNQASLSLVDRELTEKLNRSFNLQVRLPR